jgi:hypothetical protein
MSAKLSLEDWKSTVKVNGARLPREFLQGEFNFQWKEKRHCDIHISMYKERETNMFAVFDDRLLWYDVLCYIMLCSCYLRFCRVQTFGAIHAKSSAGWTTYIQSLNAVSAKHKHPESHDLSCCILIRAEIPCR